MQKFFVAHEGKQTGPLSLDEVSVKLSTKNLVWNDYIYDEKNEDWILLLEFPPLTPLFNKSFKNPILAKPVTENQDPLRDRAWYILKQNNNYGPFSKAEMIQMLQSKTLFEFDFVWKQGLAAWKRLSDVTDFNPDEVRKVFEVTAGNESEGEIFYRRRHARSEYPCSLILHDRKRVFKGQSFEISQGGAGINVENVNFEIEQQLYLHFSPGGGVPAFNTICRVVSKSGSRYGLRFLHIAAEAKESISKYTNKAS